MKIATNNRRSSRTLTQTLALAFLGLSFIALLANGGISLYSDINRQRENIFTQQKLIAQNASQEVSGFFEENYKALEAATEIIELPRGTEAERSLILQSLLATQPSFRQMVLLTDSGNEAAIASRVSLEVSDQFKSQLRNTIAGQNDQTQRYIGSLYFDNTTSEPLIVLAIPVNIWDFKGTLAAEVNLQFMWTLVDDLKVGNTGYVYLVDPEGNLVAAKDTQRVLDQENVKDISKVTEFINNPLPSTDITPDITSYNGLLGSRVVGIYNPLGTPQWAVLTELPYDEAFNPIFQTIRTYLITILVLTVLAGLIGAIIARRLSIPLVDLTGTATRIAEGETDLQAVAGGVREITSLATAFNTMTSQLRSLIGNLERRVADRTRNLELAAEVGRAVSQVRDLDIMLKDACELILKEFNLYYVQVYLTDPNQTKLVLEAGTGEVGMQLLSRSHNLPFDTGSINGRAAVEKHSVVISDTAQSAAFRKNALLPETRGEMAIPLIVADKVVGVLDMQSSEPGILTEEVLPAFEALAGQMAVAVQNANLLAETEQARAQVESQARRLVRQSWNEHLDAIHKPEKLGFVFDHNQVAPLADMDEKQMPDDGKSVSAPIALTGEALGSLVVELDDEARAEQTRELVSIVARQVAQQIETLRLLESAERYRAESERVVRLQTIEGWQSYISSRPEGSLGYLYDTKEVRPQMNGKSEDASMFALPLKARDEMIGKLSVQGLTDEDQESVELVNTVAERLSAHIENLRLFEETRQGQVELDKRARQLAAVAEISTISSRELDISKLLETVANLTKERFNLYHAHVYLLSDIADTLALAAGAGDVGRQMLAEGWQIPVDHQTSIVARAARTRQTVIANDIVRDRDSEFLSNRLLPDTRSEMAVPLMVGDKMLGVFDVQSDRSNAFTQEDASIQTTLTSQVATALQNARSFTQAQKQAERESMLNVINQKIQSATSVEAVLQIAARELGHALGAPMTIAQLSMKETPS